MIIRKSVLRRSSSYLWLCIKSAFRMFCLKAGTVIKRNSIRGRIQDLGGGGGEIFFDLKVLKRGKIND